MSVIILKPVAGESAYDYGATIFKEMYETVTSKHITIAEKDDKISDLVVIGSDAVNDFVLEQVAELKIDSFGIRYGTDDYCVRSVKTDGRNALIFAGARGRSTLYAIYDYFEKFLNCHYFWDGDVLPHSDEIPMEGINICESPRFDYRGLRYFAHRGLKRFQAEHWSFEDWKKEIDWLVKKRLNFFMLRTGMDDVWQRAFPDDVPYADGFQTTRESDDAPGYNDRSDFWTLRYRGELRAKVLEYARALDLIYPTDCGTMTHWYSRTPVSFIENKKPTFAPQFGNHYCESDTGRVWDFTKKENMDNYMKLTETMVQEYDKNTELFHTIGLGERRIFSDKKKNQTMKLIAYRRIAQAIRERYPNSKLMLASWDLVGWWTGDEVKDLIRELDPERTMILDYTSDVGDPNACFINWGVVGKFPWIFGLFHGYESDSELRGAYDRSEERLKIAADDPFCKGMILWPELSHSDPLILEYLAENAWAPIKSIEDITLDFCSKRYGSYSAHMNECWQKLLPFIKTNDWGHFSKRDRSDEKFMEYTDIWWINQDMWTRLPDFLSDGYAKYDDIIKYYGLKLHKIQPMYGDIISAMKSLADNKEALKESFILRDGVDITRTILGRFMNYLIVQALKEKGNRKKIEEIKKHYLKLMDIMCELLTVNDDFSIYGTLKHLESVAPVNPEFKDTLKRNIHNRYCTQAAYELANYVFKDDAEVAFDWLMNPDSGKKPDFTEEKKRIHTAFMNKSLESMQPTEKYDLSAVISKAVLAVENLCLFINVI